MMLIWLAFLTFRFSFAEEKGFEISIGCEEVDAKIQDLDNEYRKNLLT